MPLIEPMTPAFASYLSDESRTQGQAEYIAFPRSEEEIALVLRWCAQHGVPVTAQGGMTGLARRRQPPGRPGPEPLPDGSHPGPAPGQRGHLVSAGAARGFGCCRCARR